MEIPTRIQIVSVRRQDGWIAYPLGFDIEIAARGDTREEATAGARAAVDAAIKDFGGCDRALRTPSSVGY